MDSREDSTEQRSVGESLTEAETELDLLKLDEDIDEALLDASLDQYQQYLDQLNAATSHLDELLASTTETLNELSQISAAFRAVDGQTRAFQKQTSSVLEDQKKNEASAEAIAENLQYYEPLERITRRLNAPGAGSLARSKDFSDMLVTIDECLDYMQTHPKHKEADLYRSRYRLLLTRALTLVRNAFMSSVRETTTEVAARIAAKQLNDTTQSALLYAKFRVGAADMKELGLEIQKRANPPADAQPGDEGEYQSLMNELHGSFAACRARLVLPIVQRKLAEISQDPTSKDLVQFSRASISFIRGVCLDEFELWDEWFHGQRGLYEFLESICEPLYDYLRPRIVHEAKLSKLCSLVSLIQTRYMHDDEDDGPQDLNQLDFSLLVQPALEDTQTRLLFRAQAIVRDEIENYKPSPSDLDWPSQTSRPTAASGPTALSGRKSSHKASTSGSEDDSLPWSLASRQHTALHTSYPTLPKAIYLLSRIYRLINSSIFDDLAHQIVHQTTLSLTHASTLISSKHSAADGQLFLLRHLLLLKSQIVAFDIEFVTPDISFDFSAVTQTFYELRSRGGLFDYRNWLRLFSTSTLLPRVVENMLDAKVELDGQLRNVINEFTAGFAGTMTELLPKEGDQRTKTKVEDAVGATRKRLEVEVPVLRAKLEQYIADERTRETLVAAVEDQVVQGYEAFFEGYVGSGKVANGGGKKGISRKGKSPESEVWDSDTFGEWCEGVFNVAKWVDGVDEEDGSRSVGSRSLSRSGSS